AARAQGARGSRLLGLGHRRGRRRRRVASQGRLGPPGQGAHAMKTAACLLALVLSLSAEAQQPETRPGSETWIRAARLFDGHGDAMQNAVLVRVHGARIAEVAPDDGRAAPDGVRVVKLDDATLLPGLIDLHTHLLLHPYYETSWDDQVLKESLELRT